MTRTRINGIDIHYEIQGEGPPLVLIHGSWGDAVEWEAVTGPLAERFQVISYDRRGHSRSGPVSEDHDRRADEDDLAAIIETLAGGSAHVAANSFGGVIALGLTARRPELVRSISVHEAPVLSVLPEEAGAGFLHAAKTIAEQIDAGDPEGATRRFMEEIALGPGSWELLTERERWTFVANAPTFAGEVRDPRGYDLDTDALVRARRRTQVSKGGASEPHLELWADVLAAALPHAETAVVDGAGHAPNETHPDEYVEMITSFAAAAERVAA